MPSNLAEVTQGQDSSPDAGLCLTHHLTQTDSPPQPCAELCGQTPGQARLTFQGGGWLLSPFHFLSALSLQQIHLLMRAKVSSCRNQTDWSQLCRQLGVL